MSLLVPLVKLTEFQWRLLLCVSKNKSMNATRFVLSFPCAPRSTVWHNLRVLRNRGLLEFGLDSPVSLTELGAVVCVFKEEGDEDGC